MRFDLFSKFSGTALFSCINLAINMFQSKNTHKKVLLCVAKTLINAQKNIYIGKETLKNIAFLFFFE